MACSPGEEAALEAAANLLDQEAKDLNSNNQKITRIKNAFDD
jgi:cell division protein ZapA (FtsZ GTPase activity inhibitor)